MPYIAYILDEDSREKLKKKFPPQYSRFIGHHITEEFGKHLMPDDVPDDTNYTFNVIGYVNTNEENGLEALVVSVNGKTHKKDGFRYHITWSLEPEVYKPFDSNTVIDLYGFEKIVPIEINATAKYVKR